MRMLRAVHCKVQLVVRPHIVDTTVHVSMKITTQAFQHTTTSLIAISTNVGAINSAHNIRINRHIDIGVEHDA